MTTGAGTEHHRLDRLNRILQIVEDGLLVVLLSLMIGLAGMQILLRNLLNSGLVWGDPLLRVLVLWTGLLGAMVATRKGDHIAIDVLTRFLPAWAKTLSRSVTDLFSAAVCILLAYHGARLVSIDWTFATPAFGPVPAWVCELILPFGFGVIAFRFLLSFFSHFSAPRASR